MPMVMMMRGVLFHTMRGDLCSMMRATLSHPPGSVDVARIMEVHFRFRWFMVMQRNLPCEVEILYEHKRPRERLDIAPTMTFGNCNFGAALTTSYEFEHWLTFRYPSEREARLDMLAIEYKQKQLAKLARRMAVECEGLEA
jgi:hypothetical protein